MQAIIRALEAPPRLSIRSIVSLESRYGMYFAYSSLLAAAAPPAATGFFFSVDDSIEITFPSVNKLLLI